jgi:2-polyprenyl-3-methyl-5-hydroxy-6-metoxy-1,4-benzoquinol methylase
MLDHEKNDHHGSKAASAMPPTCPVSHSTLTHRLCEVDGFDIWRCPETATDFVWPMPGEAVLKKLYDREAWFEGGERGGYENYDVQTEPSLHLVASLLDRFPQREAAYSVLDVGCGYGTHLKVAADRQWKCVGVEPSLHARNIAIERHGEQMSIVERVEDVLPQCFDLVLLLEVIEHLTDPYTLFFTLFGKGLIGPETLVVVTTPNARSNDAVESLGSWAYRHPPSHLVYYSAKSLGIFLKRLMFKDITLRGLVDLPPRETVRFADEESSINDALSSSLGVCAEAKGSDFKEFMHERYVPGAYWKLTEYEHLPRYAFASTFAKNAKALDFGCGTGYGSKYLSNVAASVVGLDISEEAISWAKEMHRNPGLQFERRSDLGQGMEPHSFDLVTCFEMIEHVNHEMQIATVSSIANLLKPEGKLVISTPDPQFTAPYGDNPYHLREMTEVEFRELLEVSFKHVTMLKQWIRPNVFIGLETIPTNDAIEFGRVTPTGTDDFPIGFVAICSNQPFDLPPQFCQFDTTSDYTGQMLEAEHRLNRQRFDNQKLVERNERLSADKEWHIEQVHLHKAVLQERDAELQLRREEFQATLRVMQEREHELSGLKQELNDTRTWVASLNEGKDWLAEQNRKLEIQIAEQRRIAQEAETRLSIIMNSKAYRSLKKLGLAPTPGLEKQ